MKSCYQILLKYCIKGDYAGIALGKIDCYACALSDALLIGESQIDNKV